MDRRTLLIIVAAAAVAVVAIAVAISTRPQCPQCQPCPTCPTPPNATVRLLGAVEVDYPGHWRVPIGWAYATGDAVLWLNATVPGGHVYAIYIDGVAYGNPTTAWLTPGNHTIEVSIYAPRATKIYVEYRVGA